MCRRPFLSAALVVIALVAVPGLLIAEVGHSGFEHFISRDGDRLMDGNEVFRFIGVNMPGLNLPYDYFYGISERMVLPTPWEQEDGFKTMARMGVTCVRTWNLPIAAVGEKDARRFKYVLGPILIRRAVLVDEMKTFDLTAGRSHGVTLVDKDNYHFAEHYYRVNGKAGDWLVYRSPDGLELDCFCLSVWNPTASPGLRTLVSSDGHNWQDVTPAPDVRDYKPYYARGKWAKIRATEHRLRATDLPAGMHLLKLEWPDVALLDRVELNFRQARN